MGRVMKVYETQYGMAAEVGCAAVRWVRHEALRCFRHVMRMNEDDFLKSA